MQPKTSDYTKKFFVKFIQSSPGTVGFSNTAHSEEDRTNHTLTEIKMEIK